MEKWSGRVALVTGASVGIGAAICRSLVDSGLTVVGAARSVDKIQKLSEELTGCKGILHPIHCDVTKDDDVIKMFDEIKAKFGGVDICINNAGSAIANKLVDGTPEEWRSVMDLNVISLCLCTKLAILSMRERKVDDGHIIHISSMSAYRIPSPEMSFYAATKYAVRALAEGLRKELREANSHIKVTCVSPGFVETEFAQRVFGSMKDGDKFMATAYKALQASDIADLVKTILSAGPHVEINDILLRPTEQLF